MRIAGQHGEASYTADRVLRLSRPARAAESKSSTMSGTTRIRSGR